MSNENLESVNAALRLINENSVGVLDKSFLSQSLSALDPKEPICIREEQSVEETLAALREHKIGCVLIVDSDGKLTGIFSERDFLIKVAKEYESVRLEPITRFMTPSPIAESMDCTVAFALNLMSHGGFRHLPIVDGDGRPVGAISVKDVVDFLVNTFTEDLLNFNTDLALD